MYISLLSLRHLPLTLLRARNVPMEVRVVGRATYLRSTYEGSSTEYVLELPQSKKWLQYDTSRWLLRKTNTCDVWFCSAGSCYYCSKQILKNWYLVQYHTIIIAIHMFFFNIFSLLVERSSHHRKAIFFFQFHFSSTLKHTSNIIPRSLTILSCTLVDWAASFYIAHITVPM